VAASLIRRLPGGGLADAFGDLEPPPARHKRGRRLLEQVVEIAARGAPQFDPISRRSVPAT